MINKFQEEHRFLSNFWPARVSYLGISYPSVEHAYQAAKLPPGLSFTGYRNMTPGQAKRRSKKMPLRKDWEQVKLQIMRELVAQKFLAPELAKNLHATFPHELIEGNYWHDLFWGQCFCPKHRGKGQNNLGKILMQVRTSLRAKEVEDENRR